MKSLKFLFLNVVLVTLFISCKEEKANDKINNEPQELKETFEVNFNLTISKDDTFTLYYTEDGTLNFGDENSVKAVVKASDIAQDVLFKLPADVLPNQIRLDFGDNPEQGSILINSMKAKYITKEFSVNFNDHEDGAKHYFYFLENQVNYNPLDGKATFLKPEGQIYDPLMWSNQLLSEELEKLYK